LAAGGAKFPIVEDSLPRTPTKHRAKFDAASSILGGEIRNRTSTKLQKSSKRYIYPHLAVSACVANKNRVAQKKWSPARAIVREGSPGGRSEAYE